WPHIMTEQKVLVIGVFGPTACRKSEFAQKMASEYQGEIINCDSIQVYTEVQIGANKPSSDELKLLPHHLFDFVAPPKIYTAGQFHRDFHSVIRERRAKTKVFFLCGGSHFYARAALKGLYPVEPSDPAIRSALTIEWDQDNGKKL